MTNLKEMLQPRLHAQSRQFFALLGLTLATVAIGLTMVASASAVDAFKETSNAASIFLKQGGFAIIGLFIACWIASALFYRWKGYDAIELTPAGEVRA